MHPGRFAGDHRMDAVQSLSNERAKPKAEASAESAAPVVNGSPTMLQKILAWANVPAVGLIGVLLYQAQSAGLEQMATQQQLFREEARLQRQHDETRNTRLGDKLDRLIELNTALLTEVRKITDGGPEIP